MYPCIDQNVTYGLAVTSLDVVSAQPLVLPLPLVAVPATQAVHHLHRQCNTSA